PNSEPLFGAAQNAAPVTRRHLRATHCRADASPHARRSNASHLRRHRASTAIPIEGVEAVRSVCLRPRPLSRRTEEADQGSEMGYESTRTWHSIRPVPRSKAVAITDDDSGSKTLSPSVSQRR